MKRHIQHEPLLIQQRIINHWSLPVHTQDFYEIIVIRNGRGYHTINGNQFPYFPGDVFVLGPMDSHFFSIEEATDFCFISFTETFLSGVTTAKNSIWKRIKNLSLHTTFGFSGSVITNQTDQLHLSSLLAILITEHRPGFQSFASVTESLMGAILSLIERHITHFSFASRQSQPYTADLVQQLMTYISQHITKPDLLRVEQLADIFHYSPGHLSVLFKQQVGESLQQYIIQYRLKLVEKRLRLSSLTVSQIADEFGFTDICHLNKLFKRYYRHTPMIYRRDCSLS